MTTATPASEWTLAAGELIGLGSYATSHIGRPDADAWWAGLDESAREAVLEAGLDAFSARPHDPNLREALRVRREARRVVVVETSDGAVLAAHAADGSVVLERAQDDFSALLLLANLDDAAATLANVIAFGMGATLEFIRVESAGGWAVSVLPDADDTWQWRSGDTGRRIETRDLPAAVALLLA